jgi:cytosine/adenosine deaminase-related metal-dependent hydrolase
VDRATLYRARFLLPITVPPIEDGALLVNSGLVCAVGTHRQMAAAHPEASLVDFGDAVLLPPLVNAHTHLELSDFPLWAAALSDTDQPQDFVAWILRLVRVRRGISAARLRDSLATGLRESLLAGTGAIGDILSSLDAVSAYRHSPLRGRVFAEVLGRDPDHVAGRLMAIEGRLNEPPAEHLAWGLAPHAPYTLSASATDRVFAFAGRHTLQCSIHLAESAAESRFLENGTGAIAERLFAAARWDAAADPAPGCSPVRAICRRGRLGPGDLAVHGVQVDSVDIDRLKEYGCCVVLCPRSNAALDVGRAPVAAYLAAGVPLALGTDSLASAPSLSIWEEIAFARDCYPGQAAPRDWLEMATRGGARALGQQDCLGQISPGREASFQVVALPELPALQELEEALCSSGRNARVTHLYLAARNVLPEC